MFETNIIMSVKLDSVLKSDSHLLGYFPNSYILLMKEKIGPWIVLVPRQQENLTEWHELTESQQNSLNKEINCISHCLKNEFPTDKLNISIIGNIVSQLHIHIVSRQKNDYIWPKPIWGNTKNVQFSSSEIMFIKNKIINYLSQNFDDFKLSK